MAMYRALTVWIAAIPMLVVAAPSLMAQPMRGIKAAEILVESLDANATDCNTSADALDAAVRIPLVQSKTFTVLPDNDPDQFTYVYVNLNVLTTSNGVCTAAITLDMKRPVKAIDTTAGDSFIASVWSSGTVIRWDRAGFARKVANELEDLTKLLIARWMKDNPTTVR